MPPPRSRPRFPLLLGWLWLAAWALVACARPFPWQPSATPSPTPSPTLLPSPTATATRSPISLPTLPPPATLTPTPTPLAIADCEPPHTAAPTTWSYPQALHGGLAAALNAGLSPSQLEATLQQAGIGGYPHAVLTGDLNGDGFADALATVLDPTSPLMPPAGSLVLLLGSPQGYCQALTYTPTAAGEPLSVPILHVVQDLDGDGRDEVLISVPSCGAHTCYETFHLFAWRDHAWHDLLDGPTDDLPNPDWALEGPDAQGRYLLAITGTGIASAGAGPQRPLTRVWTYAPDADRWRVTAEEIPPPQARIHALHDADAAARRGDETTALQLYGRVISDVELQDEGLNDPQWLHDLLANYARFRLLVLHAHAGRDILAQIAYQDLQANATGDFAPYAELGAVFWETYLQAGFEAACQAARAFAAQHATSILDPLGPQNFGYANPVYTPEDVCP